MLTDAEWWACLLVAVSEIQPTPEACERYAEALDAVLAERRARA